MRFPRLDVLKTVFYSLIWTVAIIIIGSILMILFGNRDNPNAIILMAVLILIPIFAAVIFTIERHLLRKNALKWDSLGFVPLNKKQIISLIWQVPLLWLFVFVTQIIILVILTDGKNSAGNYYSATELIEPDLFTFIIAFLSIAVITPILEEIIFRGGLLQALENKFNTPIAIVGSSLLFMAAHAFTHLIMPGLFVMGLTFAYLYKKYKSIYASIILHMFINGINVIAVMAVL